MPGSTHWEMAGQCGRKRITEALTRLVYAECLRANNEPDLAREAILAAREHLTTRAALIEDPDWRRRFLEDISENARTLALAVELEK